MKKLLFLVTVGCMGATISCKKEVSADVLAIASQSKSLQAMSQDNATNSDPMWGVWPSGSSTDRRMQEADALGVKYVRSQLQLKRFNGNDAELENYVNKGYKVLLNINWIRGNSIPFPTNMNEYKNQLQKVLDKYASKIEVVVIENEPTTDKFHSGSIENYITELKNAVSVCKQYGVKVTDGGIHIENVLLVKNGKINANKNSSEVAKLIDAYKDMDLDYVNVHTKGTGSNYPLSDFTDCADYLRNQTGHPVMSNEWHVESNSASLMSDIVKGWRAGDYKYSICASKQYPLYQNGSLTEKGRNYKDDIQ